MSAPESPKVRAIRRPALRQTASPRRREVLLRLLVGGLLAGAVALTWWSVRMRLAPLQTQVKELSSKVARVSSSVEELERRWPREQAVAITNRLDQACLQLFSDQPALEQWLANLREKADLLSLEARASFGKAIPRNTNEVELAVIPTTVSVDVHPVPDGERNASPYTRILQLSQFLVQQDKRADLAELTVQGGTNSVAGAVLVFNLWAGTEAPQ